MIDAPSAIATEAHSQATHIWLSQGGLELLFDFGQQYDLTTLHFWNYTSESFDVDNIDFTLFDDLNVNVGALSMTPALGSAPGIAAEDSVLIAPLNLRYVTAFLSGSHNGVVFQNIGFTVNLSTDRCITDPTVPICKPSLDVPSPQYWAYFH